ncbi:hypothetical protein [Sagittula sp. S175]|uniref:hypothetical protein n=1 Tax=Sagittula sp. S175 TaxID=3415129 RepID=UPI003C7AAE5C
MKIEVNGVAVTGGQLRVDYRVQNTGAGPIYLLDQFWNIEGNAFALTPGYSYRYFHGPRLVLFRGVLDVPDGIKAEVPETPYAQRVLAGGTEARFLEVPVPVMRDTGYVGPVQEAAVATPVLELDLVLGYVPEGEIPDDWGLFEGEGGSLYSVDAGLALMVQKTVSARLPVPEGLTGYIPG